VPRPQFAQIIAGTVDAQTDSTYNQGDVVDVDGSAYPYALDPVETIEELIIHDAGDIEAEITTAGGAVFTIPVSSGDVFNRWAIDSVEFQDPNNNSPALAVSWAGE
jgi:hypothetical protein